MEATDESRRLDAEDLQIQFDAVLKSVAGGNFAVARAELAAAKLLIDSIEHRRLDPVGWEAQCR